MNIITCTYNDHAQPILAIFNEAIVHSTALYEYQTRTMNDMRAWFDDKAAGNFPVIGAVDERGELLGFASYGTFRAKAAYKYTVEHSVYIEQSHRGQGVGTALMRHLIALAREQQYHVMVGGLDASNLGSRVLHEKLGFSHAGTVAQAGFKFGRWLDLAFYQLILDTPAAPVDG